MLDLRCYQTIEYKASSSASSYCVCPCLSGEAGSNYLSGFMKELFSDGEGKPFKNKAEFWRNVLVFMSFALILSTLHVL